MSPLLHFRKNIRRAAIAALTSLVSFTSVKAATIGYETSFSVPPYTLASTANGIDGWDLRAGVSSDVMVVAAPWDSEDTVLRMKRGGATGATPSLNLKNTTGTPLSGLVNVTLNAAFDYTGSTDTAFIFSFQNLGSVSPSLSFGMNYVSGIYYRYRAPGSPSATTISILSLSEVKTLSMYTFSLDIDIEAKSFSIAIAGVKADNTILNYRSEDLAFTGFAQISDFYLWQSSSTGTAYVDSLNIHQVPEPGSTALLAAALLGAGASILKKRESKARQL